MEIGPEFTNFESLRVTTSDRDWVKKTFANAEHWAYGYEVGTETEKPHFHIVFVKKATYKQDTLRKKINLEIGKGNGFYSFKQDKDKNTLYRAMSYILKGPDHEVFGSLEAHVGLVPKWVDPVQKKKKEDEKKKKEAEKKKAADQKELDKKKK